MVTQQHSRPAGPSLPHFALEIARSAANNESAFAALFKERRTQHSFVVDAHARPTGQRPAWGRHPRRSWLVLVELELCARNPKHLEHRIRSLDVLATHAAFLT